jgi:preprotein translocase SecE subunit
VARNRKRAKERRSRRPQPSVAATRGDHAAPDPLAHSSPDAELAEAQMALGRPELAPDAEPGEAQPPEVLEGDDAEEYDSPIPGVMPERLHVETGSSDAESTELAIEDGRHGEALARRESTAKRLVTFLQGSWRELQRVQWPDRRQVMQATGVVIGFVIVAGAYLGVADALAGKIVDFILK